MLCIGTHFFVTSPITEYKQVASCWIAVGGQLKRPPKDIHYPSKPKLLDRHSTAATRSLLAEKVSYEASPYHCPDPKTGRTKFRFKPTMRCPRDWSTQAALNAVRDAIRAGRMSRQKTKAGFPRHLWHQEGDIWYEAHTEEGNPGVYHGYPIEASALPPGLE